MSGVDPSSPAGSTNQAASAVSPITRRSARTMKLPLRAPSAHRKVGGALGAAAADAGSPDSSPDARRRRNMSRTPAIQLPAGRRLRRDLREPCEALRSKSFR